MKTPFIALLAAAALSMPAMAQEKSPPGNAENQPMNQGQMSQQGQTQLSSSEVKSIQEQLTKGGFRSGPADGIFGPETKAALESFQKQKGMDATGEPNQQTLAALGVTQGQGSMQNEAQGQTQAQKGQRTAKKQPQSQQDQNEPQNQPQNQPENQPQNQNQPENQNQSGQGNTQR